jgi:hypothetical protein
MTTQPTQPSPLIIHGYSGHDRAELDQEQRTIEEAQAAGRPVVVVGGFDANAIDDEARAKGIEPLTAEEYELMMQQLNEHGLSFSLRDLYAIERGLWGRPIPEQ